MIFLIIALATALITTIYVIVKRKREKEKPLPSSALSSPKHNGIDAASQAGEDEDSPPANVAIIYKSLCIQSSKHCHACGCEYTLSATICDICGEKL